MAFGPFTDRLAAGHRHRVVVEQLVGDVDAGGDALADRQDAAVEVGAVAEVGEDVRLLRERCLADPGHALAAHLGVGAGAAVHPDRHVVAADAGHRAAALGHAGAGVVRAAAAEPRRALAGVKLELGELALAGVDLGDAAVHPRGDVGRHAELVQPPGDRPGDDRRRQVGLGAQQPVLAGVGPAPLAAAVVVLGLVELAEHVGAHVGAPVVELLLELVLDDLALLLDDQDLAQPGGEVARDRRFQRPDDVDLVQPHAQPPAGGVVEAEVGQRLARVVVGLAAGDDPVAVVGAGDDVVVEPVGAHIGQRGVPLVVHQPRLLGQRRVGPADVQPAGGHDEVRRQHDGHARRVDADRGRGLDDLLDRLHRRPQPGEAAHRERVQAHVEDVLHAAREEYRQAAGLEDVVALVRRGAALGDMVVAGHRDDAAVAGGAGHVGVLEDVAAAVHARPLAVPDAEHAVVLLRVRVEVELLRAPDRGRAELLVDAGLEYDVVLGQVLPGRPQRLVVAAQRAAAVAADEAGGVEPGQQVALALQHRQPHQGLHAAHEGAAALQRVLVVEAGALDREAHGFGQRGIHAGVSSGYRGPVRRAPAALVTQRRASLQCRSHGQTGVFLSFVWTDDSRIDLSSQPVIRSLCHRQATNQGKPGGRPGPPGWTATTSPSWPSCSATRG